MAAYRSPKPLVGVRVPRGMPNQEQCMAVAKKPIVPEDTCPYIDMVQELIDSISEQDDAAWRRDQATLAKALLEYIRESNMKLRESGRYWYTRSSRS